jgi:cell wall-associated NlpC family hydrolase
VRGAIVVIVIVIVVVVAGLMAVASVAGAAPRSPAAMRAHAVSWAVKQAGVREVGQSNCSAKIDRWTLNMGLRPCRSWCGAFVHEAFRQAGVSLSARLIDPDRSYLDAIAGRRHLRAIPTSSVRSGDLLFFAFAPLKRASHVAIVRGSPQGGRVATVEGNTSNAVRLKVRGLAYAVLAARVVP